jgi:tetratricopeptide (TPR) repeat protein/transcriptional regulator with XRE-family HTH domain
MSETFSVLLRRFRTSAGLTKTELAEALGATRTSITSWEAGRRVPRDRARLEDLAHVLRLTPAETAQLAAAARRHHPSPTHREQPAVEARQTVATPTPYPSPPPPQHQLRAPIADFVGRRAEIERIVAALKGEGAPAHGAAVSGVHGMGGVGKTELAYMVAHAVRDVFPDAQIVVQLRGSSPTPLTAAQAIQQVIHAFTPDVPLPDELDALQPYYRAALHNQRALILADDAQDAEQVRPLMPPAGSVLLITSRMRFLLPGMTAIDLEALGAEEGVMLLCKICDRLDRAAAHRIAHACGYLPLALRVSGGTLRNDLALSVTAYLEQLADTRLRLSLLRDPDDPQLDVEAALALSYAKLDARAQRVFRQAGALVADFDVSLAQAVVDVAEKGEIEGLLRLLARRNMVMYDVARSRWRLHDLLRLLARHELAAKGEAEAVGWRYAQFAVQIAQETQEQYLAGEEGVLAALARFDTEHPHVDAALRWGVERTGTPSGDRLLVDATAATRYIGRLRSDRRREHIPLWESGYAAARRLTNQHAQSIALNELGVAYAALGEADQAIPYFEQCLAIARAQGDREGEGAALCNLGTAYTVLGEAEQAIPYYEQDLAIARELGDLRSEGITLGNLGNTYAELGEVRRAIECCEACLTIMREIGDQHGEGYALSYLARAQAVEGDLVRATTTCKQAVALLQEVGDLWAEAECQWLFGLALAQHGERERALPLLRAALAYEEEIGHVKATRHATLLAQLEAGEELATEGQAAPHQHAVDKEAEIYGANGAQA